MTYEALDVKTQDGVCTVTLRAFWNVPQPVIAAVNGPFRKSARQRGIGDLLAMQRERPKGFAAEAALARS